MCRRIEAAVRGELVDQYAGGKAGRSKEIERGAARPADEVNADVARWSRDLDHLFSSLPEECWSHPVGTVNGGEHPVALLPFRRWREVEVHIVDLGVGSEPQDWSDEFIAIALPGLLERLTARSGPTGLTAWLLGRGPAPDLPPWG